MDNLIKDDRSAANPQSNPNDGNIDFAGYTLSQLQELRQTIDSRLHPGNSANLAAELARRQSDPSSSVREDRTFKGRFTERDGLAGWIAACSRRLLVHGSGTIDVHQQGVTVNGCQRTWLGAAEQVTLFIPRDQLYNAARDGSRVRFEWKRPYRLARLVEIHTHSAAAAEALLAALSAGETEGFAARWAELRAFNDRLARISSPAWITLALIIANVAVSVGMFIAHRGGLDAIVLRDWGGNLGLLVINGQWWRLLSSLFIHAGWVHLIANLWVLWNVGRLTERLYGKWLFCLIYLGSGLIAGMSSAAWDVNRLSVGSSGAIFGLLGAFLALLVRRDIRIPAMFVRAHWLSTTVFILFNLVAGFMQVGIDNAAHVGGLLGGFALGFLAARPAEPEAREEFPFKESLGAVMLVGFCALAMLGQLVGFGSRFSVAEEYFNSRQWLVRGEMKNLQRWQEIAQQAGAQSISAPELGREFARDIVPFWQAAAPALEKDMGVVPPSQRRFAGLVALFARQRLAWAMAVAGAADESSHKEWAVDAVRLSQQNQVTAARIQRLVLRGSLDHRASGLSSSSLVASLRNLLVPIKWQCVHSPDLGGLHGVAATDSPSDGPMAKQTAGCRAQRLFMSGDYRALDLLIDRYRAHLSDLPDGSSSLAGVMNGFDDLFVYGRKDLLDWLSKTADWRRAVPGSVNADLVEAAVFRAWAWSARGHAAANEVSQQAWAVFAYRVEMAQATLDDLADRPDAGPVWYQLAVGVGRDTGKRPEELQEIVERGASLYPTYYPMYGQMMGVLMPRWEGSYDDENRFVNAMSNRYTTSPDLSLYARLYWMYSSLEDDQIDIFTDGTASWDLMKQGFRSLVERHPRSDAVLNAFAKFACVAGDAAQFAKLRPELAGRMSASVWSDSLSADSCATKFATRPP